MFPSDSNGNNNDPITYIDHSTILHTHFTTQFSKQEDFSLSNFHIPSPYYYYNHWSDHLEVLEGFDGNFIHQHHDLLPPQQVQQALMADNSVSDTIINLPDSSKNEGSTINCTKESHTNGNANGHQQMLWKSTSKKDRHSKIITKKGPRDRRMRLSLAVAREFFSLQDMLGYDKASKTVEWLLIQAKPEIKKLVGRSSQVSEMFNNIHSSSSVVVAAAKSPSETSEGEVVSAIDIHKAAAMEGKGKASIKGKKIIRKPRKPTFRPVTRDLREQARARAKERTKLKTMWTQRLDGQSKLCNNDPNKVSCYGNCFDIGEAYSGNQDHNSNNSYLQQAMVPEVKEVSFHNHELITRISHGDSNNISNLIFNCLQNNQQHHHLTGFLPFGKPWEEGYNNQDM